MDPRHAATTPPDSRASRRYTMDQADIPSLLKRLSSAEDETARKMAVFKLQSSINDPAFADVFIASGGLVCLRRLIMLTSGNTLAYALQSLGRLLEVDMGWDIFDGPAATDLVERIVELIVKNPLVNILRGAMSILVALVSHTTPPPAVTVASPSSSSRAAAAGLSPIASPGPQHQQPAPSSSTTRSQELVGGIRALKPAVAVYPQFFELVIQQLKSADHSLCANALMLMNAVIREAVSTPMDSASSATASATAAGQPAHQHKSALSGEEWSKFIKRLQDLGLIKAAFNLMQSSALQELAQPLLEFQALTKVLLRRWRSVPLDIDRPEHRRALKSLHLSSLAPDRKDGEEGKEKGSSGSKKPDNLDSAPPDKSKRKPEKWRRLGFQTESPAGEFGRAGFLGMMDLGDYVRRDEDAFQKLLAEQAEQAPAERCPLARASLAVTMLLYEHFEVDKDDLLAADHEAAGVGNTRNAPPDDRPPPPPPAPADKQALAGKDGGSPATAAGGKDGAAAAAAAAAADNDKTKRGSVSRNYDRLLRPLMLQWTRVHSAAVAAFFRLWKATGATNPADFDRVAELVRILVERVVGEAPRTRDPHEVEAEMAGDWPCARLRRLQMDLLQRAFDRGWGEHLRQVRGELKHEALQFVKEQRIRCLLHGSWFSLAAGAAGKDRQRFAKLSHNRRFLHYRDYSAAEAAAAAAATAAGQHEPGLDELPDVVDLSTISSVVSNVSAPNEAEEAKSGGSGGGTSSNGVKSAAAVAPAAGDSRSSAAATTTKITIYSFVDNSPANGDDPVASPPPPPAAPKGSNRNDKERPVLTLYPASHSLASEWLDGLLMLLNQAPITAETNKLVSLVSEYGLKIRLLNVRVDAAYTRPPPGAGQVPSREGLDEDYFYEV